MKVAIVWNTDKAKVIRHFGRRNREYYREEDIEDVRQALSEAGHEVCVLEGDSTLLKEIKSFSRGCKPHEMMVFNLAYGVQGECRYTHVPSILEQIGVPYVGSRPRAHTLAIDKYLTKLLLANAGLPTPAFQLIESKDDIKISDELNFPLIVKPQFESTSFGLAVVSDYKELKEAVDLIFDDYLQPVLVEKFIGGRELNCSLIGNDPPKALPLVEIDFGDNEHIERISALEAKRSRIVKHICPAKLKASLFRRVQYLTVKSFEILGCHDAIRADFRFDSDDNPYILEINSMPSVHKSGSMWIAARESGMSYTEMINSILYAAYYRYFGGLMPPPKADGRSPSKRKRRKK